MIGTCVDITAEKLERHIQGQAPYDPRGEIMAFFKHTETPLGVRWISRSRIRIETISIDGVGLTRMDKARLWLKGKFGMVAPHE